MAESVSAFCSLLAKSHDIDTCNSFTALNSCPQKASRYFRMFHWRLICHKPTGLTFVLSSYVSALKSAEGLFLLFVLWIQTRRNTFLPAAQPAAGLQAAFHFLLLQPSSKSGKNY